MICSIINEGTAPRHALGGSLPASKPVAPKHRHYTRYGLSYSHSSRGSTAPHDPRLVALPVAVLIRSPLVVLFLDLGKTNGQFGPAVFPVQLQRNEGVTLTLHSSDETRQLSCVQQKLACPRGIRDDM